MYTLLGETNIFCIFIFFLMTSGKFLAESYPCRLQKLLRQNMFVKHIIGIFTMTFFVVLSTTTAKNRRLIHIIKNAFLLYTLFLLTTKCQIYAFGLVMIMLCITYIIHIFKLEDDAAAATKKAKARRAASHYDQITTGLYVLIIATILIGVLIYMGEKKLEYKQKFSYTTFFLGKSVCKGNAPNTTNVVKSFRHAFS